MGDEHGSCMGDQLHDSISGCCYILRRCAGFANALTVRDLFSTLVFYSGTALVIGGCTQLVWVLPTTFGMSDCLVHEPC